MYRQKRGMRGSRSLGKGRMSRATSMYRMSFVKRSWFSRVTPLDSSSAMGMVEASLGMSEMSSVGTQASASGVSGVSYTHQPNMILSTLPPLTRTGCMKCQNEDFL